MKEGFKVSKVDEEHKEKNELQRMKNFSLLENCSTFTNLRLLITQVHEDISHNFLTLNRNHNRNKTKKSAQPVLVTRKLDAQPRRRMLRLSKKRRKLCRLLLERASV